MLFTFIKLLEIKSGRVQHWKRLIEIKFSRISEMTQLSRKQTQIRSDGELFVWNCRFEIQLNFRGNEIIDKVLIMRTVAIVVSVEILS